MGKGLFYVMLIWLTLSGCNDTINEVLLEESDQTEFLRGLNFKHKFWII